MTCDKHVGSIEGSYSLGRALGLTLEVSGPSSEGNNALPILLLA